MRSCILVRMKYCSTLKVLTLNCSFVCLLRYIRQSGNLSRRCPLCFTDVAIKDLKSFTMKLANVPPSVGSRLELNLLYRNKSWVIPTLEEVNMECIPSHLDSHAKFSRYVLATQEYFVQIKQDEKDALDCLYCNTMDELAKPYIQAAMNIINADDIPIVVEQKTRAFGEKDNVEYCSFYQASSGAYVFLHPFSMKCLMYEMANRKKQDTGNLPSVISGKVLESTRIEMTELNRSKYRFLGHLPMYCEFYLCDVDLGSVLSPRTKAHFKKEFRRRHQVRVRKMNDRPIDVPMRIPQVFHQEQMDFAYGIDGMVTSNFVNEELAQELQNVQVEHHASDKVASFATITQANGYFPTLGNPAAVQAAPSGAWNSATTEPLVAPAIAASSKKKKKFTKSRTLFSGSQRSYT